VTFVLETSQGEQRQISGMSDWHSQVIKGVAFSSREEGMTRVTSKPVVHYAPLSGALGGELKKHAYERCRHFFFYEFYAKALVDYLNAAHSQSFSYEDAVLIKASHQIDSGFRSKQLAYGEFDDTDPDVVKISCTVFRNIDAAHFCNLGVQEDFVTSINEFLTDAKALDLYERLKAMMGNTRWLPQRVNVGPDRVIDKLHGELALTMLTAADTKLIGTENIADYLRQAREAMETYKKGHTKANNHGVAACAEAYIDTYDEEGIQQRLYGDIHRAVAGDCFGLGLPATEYLD
jgi:hypothetical protein